jgi:hypothetical protein
MINRHTVNNSTVTSFYLDMYKQSSPKLIWNNSNSTAFHKQDNPPSSPQHIAFSTTPHFLRHYVWNLCTRVKQLPRTFLNITTGFTSTWFTDLYLQANFNVCRLCFNNTNFIAVWEIIRVIVKCFIAQQERRIWNGKITNRCVLWSVLTAVGES